ncbi:hypothetical protein CLOSTHATH_07458 [Hungatella hathewayi DSM 13479]|uniref:Uncharacterized protein n=1 Tax=Hungatella hathewayi DSM 13479 TaxID=566550 RepID=D3AUY8_9FIRM|nr:hypothetical protein CLOSTHATH_07458 [Hungatella hathewayi DSM 13479]
MEPKGFEFYSGQQLPFAFLFSIFLQLMIQIQNDTAMMFLL